MLMTFLDKQRHHVLGIVDGLSDEQTRRPILPSGWTILAMLRHLTVAVEHYWFQCIIAGAPLDHADFGSDWVVEPSASVSTSLLAYREAIARSNLVIESSVLDAAPRQTDPDLGDWKIPSVRFVLLHVLEETACHAGHLDAARELLDGRQWLVLESP